MGKIAIASVVFAAGLLLLFSSSVSMVLRPLALTAGLMFSAVGLGTLAYALEEMRNQEPEGVEE